MTSKLIIALLAAAALAPLSAQAQSNYAGISAGTSRLDLELDSIKMDDTDTAFKLYGGHQFDRTFGVEAGYLWHGKLSERVEGESFSIKTGSLYVAGTATVPLSAQFALFGKLGLARNSVKFSSSIEGSATENKTRALVGGGVTIAFTPTLSGVAEYEHFGKVFDQEGLSIKANTWTFGLRSSF